MTEAKIQANIAKYLQLRKIYFHSIPNEAYGRSVVAQMQLVAMGLRSGVADMCIWLPVQNSASKVTIGYIEVKKPSGKLSPRQLTFYKHCKDNGIPWLLAHSMYDVEAWLKELGV